MRPFSKFFFSRISRISRCTWVFTTEARVTAKYTEYAKEKTWIIGRHENPVAVATTQSSLKSKFFFFAYLAYFAVYSTCTIGRWRLWKMKKAAVPNATKAVVLGSGQGFSKMSAGMPVRLGGAFGGDATGLLNGALRQKKLG